MLMKKRRCSGITALKRVAISAITLTLFMVAFMFYKLSNDNQVLNPLVNKQLLDKSIQPDDDNPIWGKHKLAIIVPFRDRFDELMQFAPYMKKYLISKKIRHHIYVINQADSFRFNRGSLINIGVKESGDDCDYMAMHDVDLLPLNLDLNYDYPGEGPFHVSSPELHPIYHYPKFVGGILLLTREHFYEVGGLTNLFWGWGKEDDEFYVRMMQAGLQVRRPEGITTGYETFYHIHDRHKRKRDFAKYENQKQVTSKRDYKTGIRNVKYQVLSRIPLVVDGANITVINVQLTCDYRLTPFCSHPTNPPKKPRPPKRLKQ
ncbi:beta-1,4-galactosyltransferase 7-like [Tubulanus polymorphus]|uniref:beta-1,4-galactosyltransferase 7-like n=1 Tax=Tubulanus polymorphus TaxID=672921 RepID=UPI003DA3F68A